MLILAATPIGDIADASPALRRALLSADVIAAEDTRRFRALASRLELDIKAKVVSYFDGNEAARAEALLAELLAGNTVVVVTDAGMPVVSDPGFRLVNLAIAADIRVSAVPGPSAVLTALALSGLPSDRFAFEGFLPRKSSERRRRLSALVADERTLIFFEAPHRVAEFLVDAEAVLGDRPAAICRELTKTYEEVRRGPLSLLRAELGEVRGEVTLVLGGAAPGAASTTMVAAVAKVTELTGHGLRLKAAVAEVAGATGWPKNELYDAVVAGRKVGAVAGAPTTDLSIEAATESATASAEGVSGSAREGAPGAPRASASPTSGPDPATPTPAAERQVVANPSNQTKGSK